MISKPLNGVHTFAPSSRKELIKFAFENKKILVAVNAEKILHATTDSRALINRNLGYPDGIGAVWALKKKNVENVVKIPGCELWLDIITSYYKTKKFYLVGGKQNVIEATVKQLKEDFKGIHICNYRNGYIKSETEENELIDDIKIHQPDVIFVAMGSPKQELLMEKIQKQHPAVYQGLGGSFDVYTGHVKRAPKWWVDHHMEWTYRLLKQPSRIKRQFHLLRFFIKLQLNLY